MYKKIVKRVLDILLSLMGLPILLLVLAVFAPIIRLTDHGPIFYSAPRLGKDGRLFTMYKLRSMIEGAPDLRNKDGSTFNAAEDSRMTRIGRFLRKTSIDEAPQIINVLKGDMSIVGPRPDLPDALGLYKAEQKRKLDMKPGLTGFNQAFFRNSISMDRKINYDIFYVDHASFLLDLIILVKTAGSVFRRKHIFVSGSEARSSNDARRHQTLQKGINMIIGNRLSLIPLNDACFDLTLRWINDPELRYLTGARFPVSKIEHEKWFEARCTDPDNKTYAIKVLETAEIIGIIGNTHYEKIHRLTDVFFYIGDQERRCCGYGQEALALYSDFCFKEMNIHKISGFVYAYNEASIHAFMKCGYSVEGVLSSHWYKDGKYHNVCVVGRVNPAEKGGT